MKSWKSLVSENDLAPFSRRRSREDTSSSLAWSGVGRYEREKRQRSTSESSLPPLPPSSSSSSERRRPKKRQQSPSGEADNS